MPPGPNTKITTMRLPKDLMQMIARRAKKNQVSRTRMIEWILRDYVSNRSDAELRDIVTGPAKEITDENQADLFS